MVKDLCPAPGSCMKIAKQHMTLYSLVIGIALFPNQPIKSCIWLQVKLLILFIPILITNLSPPSLQEDTKTTKCHLRRMWFCTMVPSNWSLSSSPWVAGSSPTSCAPKTISLSCGVIQQLFKRVHFMEPLESHMESNEGLAYIDQQFKDVKVSFVFYFYL